VPQDLDELDDGQSTTGTCVLLQLRLCPSDHVLLTLAVHVQTNPNAGENEPVSGVQVRV